MTYIEQRCIAYDHVPFYIRRETIISFRPFLCAQFFPCFCCNQKWETCSGCIFYPLTSLFQVNQIVSDDGKKCADVFTSWKLHNNAVSFALHTFFSILYTICPPNNWTHRHWFNEVKGCVRSTTQQQQRSVCIWYQLKGLSLVLMTVLFFAVVVWWCKGHKWLWIRVKRLSVKIKWT